MTSTNKELTETYLKKEIPFEIPYEETNNHYAILVDPRPLPILPYVVYNVMRNLGSKWNLCIFGSKENREFILKNIKGRFCFLDIGVSQLNEKTYSLLLRSLDFWERIPGENIIVFQWDSFMLKPIPEDVYELFGKYGFIGSSYKFTPISATDKDITCPLHRTFNMNGGFSFRKRSVMMRCIREVSTFDIIQYRKKNNQNTDYFVYYTILNEDVFFGNAIHILGLELPTKEECGRLCVQNDWNVKTTCALHNYQYPYIPLSVFENFLKTHPNTI